MERTIAPVHAAVVRVHAPDTDRTCLFMWRMLSIALAVVTAVTMDKWEVSGMVALFGEHAGETIEYVGEWFAKM